MGTKDPHGTSLRVGRMTGELSRAKQKRRNLIDRLRRWKLVWWEAQALAAEVRALRMMLATVSEGLAPTPIHLSAFSRSMT